MSMGMHNKHFL